MQGSNSTTGARVSAALVTTMILAAGFSGISMAQAGPGIGVSIGSYSLSEGGTAVAPLRLSNVSAYGTITVNLTFNASVVHFTNYSAGNMGGSLLANIQNGSGYVRMIHTVTPGPAAGDYILAYFGLRAVGPQGSSSALNMTVEEVADQDGNPVPVTVAPGSAAIPFSPSPDLGIGGDVSLPSESKVNVTGSYRVTVRNNGSVESTSATVNFTVGTTVVGSQSVGPISAGGSTQVTFSWRPTFEQRGSQALSFSLSGITPAENGTATNPNFLSLQRTVLFHQVGLAISGANVQTTAPGLAVTFDYVLSNPANAEDTYDLVVSGEPTGWTVSLDRTFATVAPGASTAVRLTVTPPSGLGASASATIAVTARSRGEMAQEATVPSTTHAVVHPAFIVGDHTVTEGGNITVPITLRNAVNFGTATVRLSFNPQVAQAVAHANGDIPGASLTANVNNTTGVVRMIVTTPAVPAPSGNFTFATVTFRAIAAEGARTPLNLTVEEFTDSSGATQTNSTRNGELSIPRVPAPDLGILSVTPAGRVVVNRSVTVNVVVGNGGTAASTSAELAYSFGGTNGTLAVPGIAAGANVTLGISWTPTFEQRGALLLHAQLRNVTPRQNMSAGLPDSFVGLQFVDHYAVDAIPEGPVNRTTGPSTPVTYQVCVANRGNVADNVSLAVSSSLSGWTATVSPSALAQLPPGPCAPVVVTVTPPGTAPASPVVHRATLTVTSASDSTATTRIVLTTTLEDVPVVRSVSLSRASPVPAGAHTVLVAFSKPMDTTVNVSVAYGPSGGNLTLPVTGAFLNATAWSGGIAFEPGADGAYLFNVTGGFDAAGLSLVNFTGGAFRVDTVAPVTTDDAPAAWQNRTVRVAFSVSDASSVLTRYTLDGSEPNGTSPAAPAFDVSVNGVHTLRYFSVDAAGNAEGVKNATNPVRIDMLAPLVTATPVGVAGTNGWFTSNVTVNLSATDNLSGVAAILYAFGSDAMTRVNASEHSLVVAAQGATVLRYAALDVAGNVAPVQTLSLRIDTGLPNASATATPTPGEEGWSRGPVRVDVNGGDATSGLAALFFRLGADGAWVEVQAPHTLTVSEEGNYTVESFARDLAGNNGTVGIIQFRIDATPPTPAVLLGGIEGENGWHRGDVTVTLQAFDNMSGVARIAYRIGASNATNYSEPFTVSADGVHELLVTAFDVAGNPSAALLRVVRVDHAAPVTTALVNGTHGTNGWRTGNVTVTLHARDNVSGVQSVWYRIDGGDLQRYNGSISLTEEGNRTVTYNASDVAGHTEAPRTLVVRLDKTPPQASFEPPVPETTPQFSNVSVQLRVVDAHVAEAKIEFTGPNNETRRANATDSDGDGVFNATVGPLNLAGNWTLRGLVRDQAGLPGASLPIVVQVSDGVAPSVGIAEPAGLFVRGNATVRADASDTGGIAHVRFFVEGLLVSNDTSAPYTFVWNTSEGPNGFRNVSANATDRFGNSQNATRAYYVMNLPAITGVTSSPALDPAAPSPVAGDNIVVNATVTGTSPPFATLLRYRVNATGASVNVTGVPTGDDRYTFDLGMHSASFLDYEIFATDSANLTARVNGTVTVFPRPDPANYTGASLQGTSDIDHDWADITDAGYEQLGASLVFGMKMEGPLNYSAGALYIIDFDTNNDTIVDYNLTATYTPGPAPVTWTTTFSNVTTGPVTPQPVVSLVAIQPMGIVAMVANVADLAPYLATSDLQVRFRTVGSTDSTLSVPLDVVKPVIVLTPPATARNDADAVFTATVTDASGLGSVAFRYSINNGAYATLQATPVAGVYTWTVPAPAAGTLSYFVTATDTVGNTETTATASLNVGDAVPPTASIAAIAPADQGTPVEFRATGVSADAVSFAWTFGDGTPSASGATVTHVYQQPGQYQANLTVSDAFLNSVTQTVTVTIRDALPPLVTLTSPAASAVVGPTPGAITGTATDGGGIASVRVTPGDGAPITATYTPATGAWSADWNRASFAGTTTVVLLRATARDNAGLESTTAGTLVTVDGTPPVAAIGGAGGAAGTALAFTAAGSTDDIASAAQLTYSWDFDASDGISAQAQGLAVSRTYAAAGTYTVTVTVSDTAGNTDTATLQVTVTAATGGFVGGGGGGGGGTIPVAVPPVTTPSTNATTNVTANTTTNTTTGTVAALSSVVAQESLALARNLTGLDLPQPFGAVNSTTFLDPNGKLLQLRPASTLDGRALFVVSKVNGTGAAFLFDAGTNTIIPVLNPVPQIDAPKPGVVNGTQVVTVRVAKADWIYFEIDDPAPGEALVEIRAGDGRVISADRIWRANGRIAVLDDPDTVYHVVLSSSDPVETPDAPTTPTSETDSPCPPKCGGGGGGSDSLDDTIPTSPTTPTRGAGGSGSEASGATTDGKKGRIPGFEAAALVAALGAAMLVLRRRRS